MRINQKEYLPSAELGKKFNYTSDYISKLARDEKVLGTRVGRQWFVEPESLRTYIQQLEVEKQINKEKLSRQRKIEHKNHLGQSWAVDSVSGSENKSLIAAGQAFVVVLCGALVGVVASASYLAGLEWQDVASGAHVVVHEITSEVSSGFFFLASTAGVSNQEMLAGPLHGFDDNTVSESELVLIGVGPQVVVNGYYTIFPSVSQTDRFAPDEMLDQVGLRQSGEGYVLPFSDDLLVEDTDQDLRVRPVFRDSTGELYQLSAIPVTSDNE